MGGFLYKVGCGYCLKNIFLIVLKSCRGDFVNENKYTLKKDTLIFDSDMDTIYVISKIPYKKIKNVVLPNKLNDFPSIVLEKLTNLESVLISKDNPNYTSLNGVLFNKDLSKIVFYPPGKRETEYTVPNSVKEIAVNAFNGSKNLENVYFPNDLNVISSLSFCQCSNLKSVKFPPGLEIVGSFAFANCSSLQNIVLNNGLTYIGYNAFFGCESLSDVMIPDSVKTIGWNLFHGCKSLRSVTFGKGIVEIPATVFGKCSNLKKMVFKGSIEKIHYNALGDCNLNGLKVYCNDNPVVYDWAKENGLKIVGSKIADFLQDVSLENNIRT